jgi:hypothetical protein
MQNENACSVVCLGLDNFRDIITVQITVQIPYLQRLRLAASVHISDQHLDSIWEIAPDFGASPERGSAIYMLAHFRALARMFR